MVSALLPPGLASATGASVRRRVPGNEAAPALEPGEGGSASDAVMETAKTIRYLVYANWAERCEP